MKRILILSLILFAAGCSSTKNSDAQGTSMQGMWTVTGNLGSQGGSETYQVKFVSSPAASPAQWARSLCKDLFALSLTVTLGRVYLRQGRPRNSQIPALIFRILRNPQKL